MRFADSETQKLLRTTARSYLAEAFPARRLFAIERGDEQLGPADVRGFAELGWLGLLTAETAGGGGASLLEAAAVVDELGYAAVAAPVTAHNIAACLLASARGSDELSGRLRRLAAGDDLYTISESTRGGDSPLTVEGGLLNGTLPPVPFAAGSDFVLAPVTSESQPAFAAIPLANAEREPVRLLDRPGYAHLRLRDADARDALILATGDAAHALHERGNALSTAFALIEMGGMMQRVLEMTAQYISQRVQFGQPIAKFQAARHRAAELLLQTETTRWAAYYAVWRLEQDPSDTGGVWLAKHWAARAADRVYQISHLLHGGVGVGIEYPLHLYTQGIAALAVRAGTMNEMVDRTIESLRLAEARA